MTLAQCLWRATIQQCHNIAVIKCSTNIFLSICSADQMMRKPVSALNNRRPITQYAKMAAAMGGNPRYKVCECYTAVIANINDLVGLFCVYHWPVMLKNISAASRILENRPPEKFPAWLPISLVMAIFVLQCSAVLRLVIIFSLWFNLT